MRSIRGSSPLTRGKPLQGGAEEGLGGLIPAHAGKTRTPSGSSSGRRAHPRSRGENRAFWRLVSVVPGSSPLTRGKPARTRGAPSTGGLIPAHAGKTHTHGRTLYKAQAHPRSRGENVCCWSVCVCTSGSSPLTRGKRLAFFVVFLCCGLIPAHAGKTTSVQGRPLGLWAHPRSRGENTTHNKGAITRAGSSPLTRGKRPSPNQRHNISGLIPAHAGKTASQALALRRQRAHPRSRGENRVCKTCATGVEGSSPLTRGKLMLTTINQPTMGLIPAHAGKTLRILANHRDTWAHPRSRGENRFVQHLGCVASGSSPLTRGKLCAGCFAWLTGGLIPAHAGKTRTMPADCFR